MQEIRQGCDRGYSEEAVGAAAESFDDAPARNEPISRERGAPAPQADQERSWSSAVPAARNEPIRNDDAARGDASSGGMGMYACPCPEAEDSKSSCLCHPAEEEVECRLDPPSEDHLARDEPIRNVIGAGVLQNDTNPDRGFAEIGGFDAPPLTPALSPEYKGEGVASARNEPIKEAKAQATAVPHVAVARNEAIRTPAGVDGAATLIAGESTRSLKSMSRPPARPFSSPPPVRLPGVVPQPRR